MLLSLNVAAFNVVGCLCQRLVCRIISGTTRVDMSKAVKSVEKLIIRTRNIDAVIFSVEIVNKSYRIDHKCYVQPLGRDKKAKNQVYIFYDFECMLDKDNNHVPNLAVANKVCQKCMDIPMNEPDDVCECAREQKIFKGASTLNDFCDWLFNTNNKAICFAHNAQAYDLHLIMQYIHERGVRPEMIRNGQKILCLQAEWFEIYRFSQLFPHGFG